jgi:catechol 2,3-dioxygenase-like lactoylglutathione lyase family enzyme
VRITSAAIPVRNADATSRFFLEVLGLPVGLTDDGTVEVQVGSSRLELRHDDEAVGGHHLALAVPEQAFGDARDWLLQRADVLTDEEGIDEFEGPEAWDSRSVYFAGPEGAVLELIAHRRRDEPYDPPFTSGSILRISEVGVAVDDVPAAVAGLLLETGLQPFGTPSAEFAAVGDAEGLLIVVPSGRPWFPTSDRVAGQDFVTVTASGGTPQVVAVGGSAVLALEA